MCQSIQGCFLPWPFRPEDRLPPACAAWGTAPCGLVEAYRGKDTEPCSVTRVDCVFTAVPLWRASALPATEADFLGGRRVPRPCQLLENPLHTKDQAHREEAGPKDCMVQPPEAASEVLRSRRRMESALPQLRGGFCPPGGWQGDSQAQPWNSRGRTDSGFDAPSPLPRGLRGSRHSEELPAPSASGLEMSLLVGKNSRRSVTPRERSPGGLRSSRRRPVPGCQFIGGTCFLLPWRSSWRHLTPVK